MEEKDFEKMIHIYIENEKLSPQTAEKILQIIINKYINGKRDD